MKATRPNPRQRQTKVPFGWTQVYRDYTDATGARKTKALWRCGQLQRTLDGEIRRCVFVCKKARIGSHDHLFTVPAAEDTEIDQDLRREPCDQSFNEHIMRAVAEFTGSGSISVSLGCSEVMRSFIIKIMNCAISHRERYPSVYFDPNEMIPTLSRKRMKDYLVDAGDEAYRLLESELRSHLYVNIMIDAATVLNMRVVHTTLGNPFSSVAPVPFHATKKEGCDWRIQEYYTEIETILTELKSAGNIIPVAICHDRLRAQSTAVARVLSKMRESVDPADCLVVDVPCLNHLLNNSFASAIEGRFRGLIQKVGNFARVLRTRDCILRLGRKCPTAPATRWLYVTDILVFIITNRPAIQQYLMERYAALHPEQEIDTKEKWEKWQVETSVPCLFVDLYAVLLPFKLASLHFESDASRLSDSLPVVHQMLKLFEKMRRDKLLQLSESSGFLHEILSQWLARLETYLPEETWACWSLTRQGRYPLRKRVVGSGRLLQGVVCDYTDQNMRKHVAADCIKREGKMLLEFLAREKKEPGGGQALIPAAELRDRDEEQLVSLALELDADEDLESLEVEDICDALVDERNLDRIFHQRLDANRGKSLVELLSVDIYYNAYPKALPVVTRYVRALHQDADDGLCLNLFDKWLYGGLPPRELERDSEYDMWANFCKYDELRPLALAALRLVSVGASEASVERLISCHRYIVHDRMTKLSAKVLLARLRLHARMVTESRRAPA